MAMLSLALPCLPLPPGLLVHEENDVLPGLANEDDDLQQPWLPDEEDDVLSLPDDGGLAEDVVRFFEQLGPMNHEERLKLMKPSFGIPSEPRCCIDAHLLPECTRDLRHVGERVWHEYYRMDKVSEREFLKGMKRRNPSCFLGQGGDRLLSSGMEDGAW